MHLCIPSSSGISTSIHTLCSPLLFLPIWLFTWQTLLFASICLFFYFENLYLYRGKCERNYFPVNQGRDWLFEMERTNILTLIFPASLRTAWFAKKRGHTKQRRWTKISFQSVDILLIPCRNELRLSTFDATRSNVCH